MITDKAFYKFEHHGIQTFRDSYGLQHCVHWDETTLEDIVAAGICESRSSAYREFGIMTKGAHRRQYGLDGLARISHDCWYCIQVKRWKGLVTLEGLTTFLEVVDRVNAKNPNSMSVLIIPHWTPVAKEVEDRVDIVFRVYETTRMEDMLPPPCAKRPRILEDNPALHPLRPYQEPAFRGFMESSSPYGVSALCEPPGTGKTTIAAHIMKESGAPTIVVVTKLLSLLDQLFVRLVPHFQDTYHCYNISSDRSTDVAPLLYPVVDKVLCFVTFHTFKMRDLATHFEGRNALIIVDEAHNLETSLLHGLLHLGQSNRVLFMSGTPRLNLWRSKGVEILPYQTLQSHIAAGNLCEYEVTLAQDSGDREDGHLVRYANFIYEEIRLKGMLNAIAYTASVSEATQLKTALLQRDPDLWCDIVTHVVNRESRREKYYDFREVPASCRVLINVDILKEGMDFPRMDGVFLSYLPPSGKLAQILGRVDRVERGRPTKVGHMGLYLMAKEVQEKFRSVVHEIHTSLDPDFYNKITVRNRPLVEWDEVEQEGFNVEMRRALTRTLVLAPTANFGRNFEKSILRRRHDPKWGLHSYMIKGDPRHLVGSPIMFYGKFFFRWFGFITDVELSIEKARELWPDDERVYDVVITIGSLQTIFAPIDVVCPGQKQLMATRFRRDPKEIDRILEDLGELI